MDWLSHSGAHCNRDSNDHGIGIASCSLLRIRSVHGENVTGERPAPFVQAGPFEGEDAFLSFVHEARSRIDQGSGAYPIPDRDALLKLSFRCMGKPSTVLGIAMVQRWILGCHSAGQRTARGRPAPGDTNLPDRRLNSPLIKTLAH